MKKVIACLMSTVASAVGAHLSLADFGSVVTDGAFFFRLIFGKLTL